MFAGHEMTGSLTKRDRTTWGTCRRCPSYYYETPNDGIKEVRNIGHKGPFVREGNDWRLLTPDEQTKWLGW